MRSVGFALWCTAMSLILTIAVFAAAYNSPSALRRACTSLGAHPGLRGSLHIRRARQSRDGGGVVDEWIHFNPLSFSSLITSGRDNSGEGFANGIAWTRGSAGEVRIEDFPASRKQRITNAFIAAYGYCGTTQIAFRSTTVLPAAASGRKYDVVRIEPAGAFRFDLYIDRKTHLPARVDEPYYYPIIRAFNSYKLLGLLEVPFGESGSGWITNASYIANNSLAPSLPRWSPQDFDIIGGQRTTVTIRFSQSALFVPVRIGESEPYLFQFDTGGRNVISSSVAKAMGLPISDSARIEGASGKSDPAAYTTIPLLRIGNAEIRNQRVLVYDGFGDGMLGYEVPARFRTSVDVRRRTMTLSTNNTPLLNPIPFAYYRGTIPLVRATVGGVSGWFQFDTGSGREVALTSPFIARNPRLASKCIATIRYANVPGGQTGATICAGSELAIGPYVIQRPATYYGKDVAGPFADADLAGNIGMGALQLFTVTLDYSHRQLSLETNDAFETIARDRTGLSLVNEPNGLYIDYVAPGPAFAAGLRAGDTIVSLGTRDAATIDAIEALNLFAAANGAPLAVTVKHSTGASESLLYRTTEKPHAATTKIGVASRRSTHGSTLRKRHR